ncbi:MAG: MFS transporter [Candidatus Hodarchaeota archaeon]
MMQPKLDNTQLYKRNITLLYVLSILAGLSFIYDPILTLYYQSFKMNYLQVSLTLITTSIFIIIFEAPSGAFADLYGKKKSTIIGAILAIVHYLIQFLSTGFIMFLVANVFWGISVTFFSGALIAFLHDTLKSLGKEDAFVKYNSRYEGTILGITILTGFLGPFVFYINKRLPFLFSLLFGTIYLIICFFLHETETRTVKQYSIREHYRQMKEGFIFISRKKGLLWLVFFSIIGIIVSRVVGVIVNSPYIIEIGFSLQYLGWIGLVGTSIQVLFILLTPKLEKLVGKKFTFVLIVFGIGGLLLLLLLVTNFLIAIIFGFFWGIISFNDIIIQNHLTLQTTKDNRATVISIHSMMLAIYGIILLPVFGLLTDITSLAITILILAGMVLVLGPVFLLARKGIPTKKQS